jgi:outer membrane protein TolC
MLKQPEKKRKIKKMRNKFFTIFFLFLFAMYSLYAQTTKEFTFEEFIEIVQKNHPFVNQARLLQKAAQAQLMQARGSFDPVITSNFAEKEFTAKEYYTNWDGYLKVPTWFGPDLKLGIDNRFGNFVNPEEVTPPGGLLYAGINIPLGQGIIIDERRAILKQAKIAVKLNAAQQQSVINKIIKSASKDYWEWYYYYKQFKLYETGLILAEFRLRAINERIKFGDEAPIDSVEAKIEVQNRIALLNRAQLNYKNYALIVSNYMWTQDGSPLELKENVVPSDKGTDLRNNITSDTLKTRMDWANVNHPDILKQTYKIDQLKIDRKLNIEMLKPNVNINAGTLGFATPYNLDFSSSSLQTNYKIGMDVYVPIFMRKQRGKLKQTNVKLMDADYELDYLGLSVKNGIMMAFNEMFAIQQLMPVQRDNVQNSIVLRDAEQRKFENGESSLFLINTREQKLIESQIKLEKLKADYAKSKVDFMFSTGVIRFNDF